MQEDLAVNTQSSVNSSTFPSENNGDEILVHSAVYDWIWWRFSVPSV